MIENGARPFSLDGRRGSREHRQALAQYIVETAYRTRPRQTNKIPAMVIATSNFRFNYDLFVAIADQIEEQHYALYRQSFITQHDSGEAGFDPTIPFRLIGWSPMFIRHRKNQFASIREWSPFERSLEQNQLIILDGLDAFRQHPTHDELDAHARSHLYQIDYTVLTGHQSIWQQLVRRLKRV